MRGGEDVTIIELLQALDIGDQSTTAKYQDGSGQADCYDLHIGMSSHGSLLNAEVEKVVVRRGSVFILAEGNRSLQADGV